MSDSHQPSSSRRAARNPYSQVVINNRLADFLAGHNLPVPDSLKRPVQPKTCPARSNKRQRPEHEEHNNNPDVCFHFLAFKFFTSHPIAE